MNVAQTGESTGLQRHKQQIRDAAVKEEQRADELSRDGVDDLYTSRDLADKAVLSQENAEVLDKRADSARRKGARQSKRGLENLANGSDKFSQSSDKAEKGLADLKGSLADLTTASEQKGQGLALAREGLGEQLVENGAQAVHLAKLQDVNAKDAELDPVKAEQLATLDANLGQRQEGLDRQTEQLDSYFLAGQKFADGTTIKSEGYANLQSATQHNVTAEAYGDAREGQELHQVWNQAEQSRHQETSRDLEYSAIFQSLKAKAHELSAGFHKRNAAQDNMSADGLETQANSLKAESAALLQNARMLERSGQCHIAIGRQMQCCPWTYCQGVNLERQGCAEVAEAQRMKGLASEKRAEGQRLSLQAEELRAKAEDSQARAEEDEVKGHGAMTRKSLLQTRSDEHKSEGEKAGEKAAQAGQAAAGYDALSQEHQAIAKDLSAQGTARLEQGFEQQEQALRNQSTAGQAFSGELTSEAGLTQQSQATTGEALATVAEEVSFLGRGAGLLHKVGASQKREGEAQGKIKTGTEQIETGLTASEMAQQKGVDAAKMLEEARELELEGLRLQNRGQKMLLEARPKLALSARLSAESFEASQDAQRYDEEAARLIESGNQKIAAANILRDKAARYREIAD